MMLSEGSAPEPVDLTSDMLFSPIREGNVYEVTVGRLVQIIRLGVVAPGEALPPERDLAVSFSISRETVREAIRSLTDAGYLIARRGRTGGTFVRDPLPEPTLQTRAYTRGEVDDILVVRETLEVGVVRLVARAKLGAPQREVLLAKLESAAGATPEHYRRCDSLLHLALAELAGSPTLLRLLADSRIQINGLLDSFPLLEPNIINSDEQHRIIVSAVLAGDPDGAGEAMVSHLAGTAALIRGFWT